VLRQQGKLPKWDASADNRLHPDAPLPERFSSVMFVDPEPAYESIAKLAPIAVSIAIGALKEERLIPSDLELPLSPADMPVPELVVGSLFPNVSSSETLDDRVVWRSRSSLPGIPLLSGVGGSSGVATAAVATALILPAIRQSRLAALRSQSKNNLKQLALAMHNHLDAHKVLPSGTVVNEKLEPEQRLSWMVPLLPYLEQQALYQRINQEAAWNDESNRNYTRVHLRVFVNPGFQEGVSPGVTNYVGMAGVGEGSEKLPVRHPKAGVFGLDRQTGFQHITDGTSNTIMISESTNGGNWAQGGRSTLRSLTAKPYINGPDGIGGPYPGGCHMGLCDGSVRFISENIDPEVLEALTTISGGEVIGDF
jgi:hypothetical protein